MVFVSSETALSYVGQIGDDGGFELKQGDRVGAPAGNYKVRIEIDETSLPKRSGKSSNLPFPPRYLDEDVSKLAATVKAEHGEYLRVQAHQMNFTCVLLGRCDRWHGLRSQALPTEPLTDPVQLLPLPR